MDAAFPSLEAVRSNGRHWLDRGRYCSEPDSHATEEDHERAHVFDDRSSFGDHTLSTVACFAKPGDRVFFGNCTGIAYDTPEEADKLWRDFELTVVFDGQTINLPPFGCLDIDPGDADEQTIRFWNLMVEQVTPGMHTIYGLSGRGP